MITPPCKATGKYAMQSRLHPPPSPEIHQHRRPSRHRLPPFPIPSFRQLRAKTLPIGGGKDASPPPSLPHSGQGQPSGNIVCYHAPLQGQLPHSHGISLFIGCREHALLRPMNSPLRHIHGVGLVLLHQIPRRSGGHDQCLHLPRPPPPQQAMMPPS